MKPIVEYMSGEGSTNYRMIQTCLFLTLLKLRWPSYHGVVACTILDSTKWQVAWQTWDSACFVGSPQLCCQSVQDGCKLMLISFCWSAYSNSLPGFPFWNARLPVGYVIKLRKKKRFYFSCRNMWAWIPRRGDYPSSSWLETLPSAWGPGSGLEGASTLLMKQKRCLNLLALLGVNILSIWSVNWHLDG